MSFSTELSTGPVSSKIFRIEKDTIHYGENKIDSNTVSAFRYSKTVNKIQGIKTSTRFEFNLKTADEKEFDIVFAGVAGSTANMEKQYAKIMDLLFKMIGNRIMNDAYKSLLEGKPVNICDGSRLEPAGFVIIKSHFFRKNSEHLIKWEDLDYQYSDFATGYVKIKSIGEEESASVEYSMFSWNVPVLFSLLKWLYHDSDRIAMIYKANGIEF